MTGKTILRKGRYGTLSAVCAVVGTVGLAAAVAAQPAGTGAPPAPSYLAREAAVRLALQNNPYLMTVRQQYGFGQAAIVSARTYPFNPVYGGVVAQNGGPTSAGIENRVFNEHYVTLELELRGQGKYRRAAASATANRIEWEIVQQEMAVSIAVIRAYNTVLYRQKKLEALDETIKLNEQVVELAGRLFNAGKMKAVDLVMARAELDNTRAQRGQAKTTLTVGRSDLRRQMGLADDSFVVYGNIEVSLPAADQEALTQLALDQRPDLRARQAAVGEAQNGLQLVKANRFGNPSVGPFYEYDNSRISIIGAKMSMPLPSLNLHRGEIMKAETDLSKACSEVQQLRVQTALDVQAALARIADAKKWAADYEQQVVPNLHKTREEVEKLFANNDPSVDLTRLLLVTRLFLKANETLVDARYEVSQAEGDLALAVAEPTLAIGPSLPPAPANLPPAPLNLPPTVSRASAELPARARLGPPMAVPQGPKY